jgi:DNA modification methylase
LGVYGQEWECLRVLKHGGHLLAFGGSRTYHRLAVAIEDAGFQIRDQIMWVYGSGFPKSLNVSKSIEGLLTTGSANKTAFKNLSGEQVDRGNWGIAKQQFTHGQRDKNYDETASATVLGKLEPTTDEAKQWDGWGTALKPAHEPIVLARKPLDGTVANNVLVHGVGGINIDGCRVGEGTGETKTVNYPDIRGNNYNNAEGTVEYQVTSQGRFPANFIHDGSDEVLQLFPSDKPDQSAGRFFYCAKANKKDRNEGLDGFEEKRPDERSVTGMGTFEEKGVAKQANHHPTVKPTDLMRYLCRLVTPPNGVVLDPFTGSGSTGKAAVLEGFSFIGVEQSEEYIKIAQARIESANK